jgi:hypothetical protein
MIRNPVKRWAIVGSPSGRRRAGDHDHPPRRTVPGRGYRRLDWRISFSAATSVLDPNVRKKKAAPGWLCTRERHRVSLIREWGRPGETAAARELGGTLGPGGNYFASSCSACC